MTNKTFTLHISQGRGATGAPPKIGKNMIFHTKYPKNFRNFFKCALPNLKSWICPCIIYNLLYISFFQQVLAAEGEQRASRALKEAADIMAQSPAAIQLRYLQTLNSIAAERNSTIVFPLPMDLLKGLAK